MKKYTKLILKMVTILVLAVSLQSPVMTHAQVKTIPTAGFVINGKLVNGIKPIKMNGATYLPFIQLSKILGYNDIQFHPKAVYQITDGSTVVRVAVGGTLAKKSNEYIHIDPVRWVNKVAYISLSAASDLFNAYMYFKPENGTIQVQRPAKYYIVQKNDSLYLIAKAHHTSIYDLKVANNLQSDKIYVGNRLRLPNWNQTHETEPIKENQQVPMPDGQKNPSVISANLISFAKKYIGAGYKFGASQADIPKLFDCSSYTQHVFSLSGLNLPRTSREQASKGTTVTALKQGDLLFFTTADLYSDGRVGHVGIYMSDGSMIHASSSKGVTITNNVMNNSYWKKNYLFAKRIIH